MKRILLAGPPDTFSGYGYRTYDLFKAIIEIYGEDNQIEVLSRRWGASPFGLLDERKDKLIKSRVVQKPEGDYDLSIQVTVPNEFIPMAKKNIGITAGVETDKCSLKFLEGLNKINMTLTSSNFTKNVLNGTIFKRYNNGKEIGIYRNEKPIDVLFEGYDTNIYKRINLKEGEIFNNINNIPEDFLFLTSGSWLPGIYGEDRKNLGETIFNFLDAFKNKKEKPGLLLKVSGLPYSKTDKYHIDKKIKSIYDMFKESDDLPNIYIIYGNLTDTEMNELYNHPKIKAMYLLTKGEGFGRPFLEFASIGKPIITSAWSGHLDFLKPDEHLLVKGELKPVHKSSLMGDIIVENSLWFKANNMEAVGALNHLYSNYSYHIMRAKKGADRVNREFTYNQMKNRIKYLFEKYKFLENEEPVNFRKPILRKIE